MELWWSLGGREVHGITPGTIADIVPSLYPPAVVAGTQGNSYGREQTGRSATHLACLIPFGVDDGGGTIRIQLTDPQVIPGCSTDCIPAVGGRGSPDAASGRDQSCFPWWSRTEAHRITPRAIPRIVPRLYPPSMWATAQSQTSRYDRASAAITTGLRRGVPLLEDIPRRPIDP